MKGGYCYLVGQGGSFEGYKDLFVTESLAKVQKFLYEKYPNEDSNSCIEQLRSKKAAYVEFPPKSQIFYYVKIMTKLEEEEEEDLSLIDLEIKHCIEILGRETLDEPLRENFEAHLNNLVKTKTFM